MPTSDPPEDPSAAALLIPGGITQFHLVYSAARKTIRSDVQYNPQAIRSVRGRASRCPRSPHRSPPPDLSHKTYVFWNTLSFLAACPLSIPGYATSTTPHSTASDPAEVQANQCLEQGTQKLEEGDIEAAKALYKRSVEIKKTASSLFNLGVTHYHLSKSDPPHSSSSKSNSSRGV